MKIESRKLIRGCLRSVIGITAIVFVTLIGPATLPSDRSMAQSHCATLENQLKGLEAARARLQRAFRRPRARRSSRSCNRLEKSNQRSAQFSSKWIDAKAPR